jgi:hypothetical protein
VSYWPTENAAHVAAHPMHNLPLWYGTVHGGRNRSGGNFATEFWSPRDAWIRGYGLCSQASKIVLGVLQSQGLAASYLSNPEHVVVGIGDNVIDAHYGVIIPLNINTIKTNANVITTYYANFPDQIDNLIRIYANGFDVLNAEHGQELLDDEKRMFVYHWLILTSVTLTSFWWLLAVLKKRRSTAYK